MKSFILISLIALLICQTQTATITIQACITANGTALDAAQEITSEANDTIVNLQTCLATFSSLTTAGTLSIDLTTATALGTSTTLNLDMFSALTGFTINISNSGLDGDQVATIVDKIVLLETAASNLVSITSTLITTSDTNTANDATFTAIDALMGLTLTTNAVTFKPFGAKSCNDLVTGDSNADACRIATDMLVSDCDSKFALAHTVSITDNVIVNFTDLNTCLNLLIAVTNLTLDINGSTIADDTAALDFGLLNNSLETLVLNISNSALEGAQIAAIIDQIVALKTTTNGATAFVSVTSTLIVAVDTNTANEATFTSLDLLMAKTFTTNAVTFKPFGSNSCGDLATSAANADACRIATDMNLSACDSKLALAHTVSITDATKATLVDLNTCINLLIAVTDLTINISGSPITDASAGLVFGALNTSIEILNLDVTDCDLNAAAILAIIGKISDFKGDNASLVNVDIKLQAGATDNTVDFDAVKAGYKLAILFTTASVQFYNGSATCSFVNDTTPTQALTVCSNYPQTLDYTVVKNGDYAGSTLTAFQSCVGASIVLTLSDPAAFTNLYADTTPVYASPTNTWTLGSTPTVANTFTIDLENTANGNYNLDVASVNDGPVTYNGAQFQFSVESCSAKAVITMVGSEGDSDYELCEDVSFTAVTTGLTGANAAVSSTTWSMVDALGATQLSKGVLTAQSTEDTFKIAKDTFISTDSKGPYTVSVVVASTPSESIVSTPVTFSFIDCDATDHQDGGKKPVTESSSILQVSVALIALFILV